MEKPFRLLLGPVNLLYVLEEERTVAYSAIMVVFCNTVVNFGTIQPNSAIESPQGV